MLLHCLDIASIYYPPLAILASHSTPDFASLQEQQFLADYESGNTVTLDDGASRSPAPSPQRLQKRPRQLTGG